MLKVAIAGLGIICALLPLAFSGCPQSGDTLARALAYLNASQTKADRNVQAPKRDIDYAGNWPQEFHFKSVQALRFNDVSPFVVAFVHHALTLVTSANADKLGISQQDVDSANEMRQRAITMMQRFASHATDPDAGTFGFWPFPDPAAHGNAVLQAVLFDLMKGPVLGGSRVPINLSWFPPEMAIPLSRANRGRGS